MATTTALTWTNSSLSALEDCGEKFRRRYIEREYRASSSRQIRGRVVHATISDAMLRKLNGGDLPPVEEIMDLAATAFTREWDAGVTLLPDEEERGLTVVRDHAKDMSIGLSVLHRTTVAPAINPIGVERRITVKPRDMDITIQGTLDLVDGLPDGDLIRDPKTSEKSPSKDMAHESQQLTMYGLLRLAEMGKLPVRYRLDYLVQTPAKKERKYVPLDTTRDMEDMHALVDRLNVAVEAVQKGSFVPANPSWWGCSAAWCEYYGDCRYVRRGDRPTS